MDIWLVGWTNTTDDINSYVAHVDKKTPKHPPHMLLKWLMPPTLLHPGYPKANVTPVI